MIVRERVAAELPGEFVVFLIGMRINARCSSTSGYPPQRPCRG